MPVAEEIDVTEAVAWRASVLQALRDTAAVHGGHPDALVDSELFHAALDEHGADDQDTPGFGAAVVSAALEAVGADPSLRVTEADNPKKPYGDVEYADPGYQKDKKPRYPLDTDKHIHAAWTYINQADNAAKYTAAQLKLVKGRIRAAMKRIGAQVSEAVSEAVIDGKRTFSETTDLVQDALAARARAAGAGGQYGYTWVSIADITDTDVVYRVAGDDDLFQCSYTIGADEAVTLGDPTEVKRTYAPAGDTSGEPDEDDDASLAAGMGASEAVRARVAGRVIEAKGTDAAGGRVFRVRIIEADKRTRNGRKYPTAVLREAIPLYEGAKAYDHHRTEEELKTSTIAGLVGHYRSVEAEADGSLSADLHLLPSATHAAESLDASLAAQRAGLEPVVGISHDVRCSFRTVVDGGQRTEEAVQIAGVDSADIVAKPSAGGRAVRAVAGGDQTDPTEESDVPPTKADVLAAFKEATDDELAAVGLARAASKTTVTPPVRATEGSTASGDGTDRVMEAAQPKTSWITRTMIQQKITAAGLPETVVESLMAELPDRVTEADVDAKIASLKSVAALFERDNLVPRYAGTQVTKEAIDKKAESLDAMFWEFGRPHDHSATSKRPNSAPAYRSFREAYFDFTGHRPRDYDEDVNRRILRESFGNGEYEYRASRATESMVASTWNTVLGDSVTRRLVAEYNEPALMDWMNIVSSMPPVNDFRTQRIERIGGYGVLPVVNQGQPYQPLTSPGNEEVTYALAKRGGTEDVTLEMIANDDLRAIAKIPFHLALAAKRTIFDFVFELVRPVAAGSGPLGTLGNPNIYDGSALYVAGHNNTAANALSQTNLSAARAAMRKQAGYGDTANILSATPRYLLVPPTLEELAFQLCTSAVAIPATPAGAANTPNIHQGLDYIVIDYWDALSATQWAVVADPNSIPTLEIGFYLGQRDPQLFTQSDPTVGSMFNADKFTYKIRHIYSGAILDFRGFQRGNS